MSTKTSIKRIALVAVAALGVSFLAFTPAKAATTADVFTTTGGASTASSTATPGVAVKGALLISGIASNPADNLTVSSTVMSAPLTSGNTTVTYTSTDDDSTTVGIQRTTTPADDNATFAANTCDATAVGRYTCYITVSYTPDKAGTYVIKLTSGNGLNNSSITWTITAAESPVDAVNSTAVLGNAANGATIATTTLTAPKAAGSAYANIQLDMTRENTTAYTGTDFSAVLSGPGLIRSVTGTCAAPANTLGTAKSTGAIDLATTPGDNCISISGDGVGGKATLSILVGSTVWKTFTINFIDTPVKFAVDATSANTVSNAVGYTTAGSVVKVLGIGLQQWWQINAFDANGVLADATPDIVVTVADETIAKSVSSVADLAAGIVKIEGVKAGTTTFTVQNAAKTFSLGPVTVQVADVKASSATLTLDKSSYAAGEAFTLTVSAKDAGGNPLADNTYAAMASLATNVVVYGSNGLVLANGVVGPKFSGGSFTVSGFMPLTTGDTTFTLTLGAAGSLGVADAAAGAKLTVTAPVTSAAISAADAAADAAAEAIDAANAATDAANLAAEAADAATVAAEEARDAADAATAAIEELATQVASLIASLKAQITTLANTVAKIAKKVKA